MTKSTVFTTNGNHMPYSRGDVVKIRVPFTDLTSVKRRPAVVVSCNALNQTIQDIIVVPVTGQAPSVPAGFSYEIADWQQAGLYIPSTAKPAIFAIESSCVTRHMGTLTPSDMAGVEDLLLAVLAL